MSVEDFIYNLENTLNDPAFSSALKVSTCKTMISSFKRNTQEQIVIRGHE